MKYKAIFFDRDGTLTYNDPEWEELRKAKLEEWSGKPFDTSYDFFMKIYQKVKSGNFPFSQYKTVEQEMLFFKQWFLFTFEELSISEKVEERAEFLIDNLWYIKKQLWSETIEVLEYFKEKNYKMGVISDSPPSLEMTLLNCEIHKYFTSFTASSLVGAGKPSPIIFQSALAAQGVAAKDSIYVDDYIIEADGARELGFTSFLIDRTGVNKSKWTITTLKEIIEFVES